MCVHVLPFEQLFRFVTDALLVYVPRFFEMFFTHGRPFLFQFGLSLVQQLEEQLLKADVSRILELLRLENTQVNYDTILDNATSFDVTTGFCKIWLLLKYRSGLPQTKSGYFRS